MSDAVNGRQTVVITGAGSGIGLATTKRLCDKGFQVVAGVRSQEAMQQLQALSPQVFPQRIDVCEPATIAAAVQFTKAHFPGGIHALVNNAGSAVTGPSETVPIERWMQQFDVNLFGVLRMSQAFIPLLRRTQGRIVNIGSASASLTLPMVGPYSASKRALEAATDALRRELYPSAIKVILIQPGQTATPIYHKSEQQLLEKLPDLHQTDGFDYRPMLERMQSLVHGSANSRRSPDRVAAAVMKAILRRHPRTRYYVGFDSRLARTIDCCVPKALADWVIAKVFRNRQT